MKMWVAMTTYNGVAYLSEQLESIAGQTLQPHGLVISDDASRDGTLSILKDFALSAPFTVTIIRQDLNVGLPANEEAALAAVPEEADVVILSGQDDIWASNKLQTIAHQFRDPKALLCISDAELIDASGKTLGARLWPAIGLTSETNLNHPSESGRFLAGVTIFGSVLAVRRSLAVDALPVPRSKDAAGRYYFQVDSWLGLVAHLLGGIRTEPEALTLYRQHPRQYTAMAALSVTLGKGLGDKRGLRLLARLEDELRRVESVIANLSRLGTFRLPTGQIPGSLSRRAHYLRSRADPHLSPGE